MRRVHGYSVATLVLIASVPLAFACGGGESKPAESPSGESSASSSSEAPAASDSAAPAESASAAPAADTSTPSSESTAASTPPPPTLESTDCGKCIDKTCAKPEAACGKNTDCQSMLDGVHRTGSHYTTESIVMRSATGTVRWVKARHTRARHQRPHGH